MALHEQHLPLHDEAAQRAFDQIANDTAVAYVRWRSGADDVARAYGLWSRAAEDQEARRFVAYTTALNRESDAAADYAAWIDRLSEWTISEDAED